MDIEYTNISWSLIWEVHDQRTKNLGMYVDVLLRFIENLGANKDLFLQYIIL